LEATGWINGGADGAAARLGLKRTTLIAKMKKLGISRPLHGTRENWEAEQVWQQASE
jgi:formate hydrogenlyase transcriptional activator